jgi:hypothetical protein
MLFYRREEHHRVTMTTISEDADSDDEEMEFSTMGNQVVKYMFALSCNPYYKRMHN